MAAVNFRDNVDIIRSGQFTKAQWRHTNAMLTGVFITTEALA